MTSPRLSLSFASFTADTHRVRSRGNIIRDPAAFEGYFPLAAEYFAYPNVRHPDRWWVDVRVAYLGITRGKEIPGVRSFPGYALNDAYYEPFEILVDPGRNRTDADLVSYRIGPSMLK